MKLETNRLIIRIPETKDAKAIAQSLNNKKMTMPYPYNISMAKDFIKKSMNQNKEKKVMNYDFVIELKSEKKVIGSIGLSEIDYFRGIGGIGYWLDEKFWKQGIISEAVEEVLKFAFGKLKLRRINLTCNGKNEGSKAVAEKFGFKLEGIIRKAHVPLSTGKIADKCYYGLLKKEWNIK